MDILAGVEKRVSLLTARADWSLADDAVAPSQVERIADAAAGDARTAITILRSAARIVERYHNETIQEAAIRAAIPEAKSEIRQADLERLTPHQTVV